MHDSLPMRGHERIADIDPDSQRVLERQRALPQAMTQGLALEVLHHQVIDVVLVTDVVQRADA